jgi:hypothetical protein
MDTEIPLWQVLPDGVGPAEGKGATFKRNVTPQPQLRNSAIAIFSEVRNLRASLPQILAYFWPWNSVDSMKKIGGNFLVSRETESSKNIFG